MSPERALDTRRGAAHDAVRESLRRCAAHAELHAFVALRCAAALAEAHELDRSGPAGPLHGVPFAVKDNIAIGGEPMTAGGCLLPDERSPRDATALARVRGAGGVVVGRANMHEFAWGGTSANPYFGDVRNPRCPDRIAGGSSGGSAAAVAAGCVPMSLGTDTGGSVRFPAALTGTVGLRPTAGTVPTEGVFPLAPTLDTVGPITATVEQNAQLFAVLSGQSAPPCTDDVDGLRLVSLRERWLDRAQPAVAAAVHAARVGLVEAGATWELIDGVDPDEATAAILPILLVEASSVHRSWIGERPSAYGADVRALVELGLTVPGVDYVEAIERGRTFRARMGALLAGADAVIGPMLPFTAPPHGADTVLLADGERVELSAVMLDHSAPAAVAGLPALSVPCGTDRDGLPIGLQLIGAPGAESTLYRIAAHVEASAREMSG